MLSTTKYHRQVTFIVITQTQPRREQGLSPATKWTRAMAWQRVLCWFGVVLLQHWLDRDCRCIQTDTNTDREVPEPFSFSATLFNHHSYHTFDLNRQSFIAPWHPIHQSPLFPCRLGQYLLRGAIGGSPLEGEDVISTCWDFCDFWVIMPGMVKFFLIIHISAWQCTLIMSWWWIGTGYG